MNDIWAQEDLLGFLLTLSLCFWFFCHYLLDLVRCWNTCKKFLCGSLFLMCSYNYFYRYEDLEPIREHIQEVAASPVNCLPCIQGNAAPTTLTSRIVKVSVALASEKHFAHSVVVKCGATFLLVVYLFTLLSDFFALKHSVGLSVISCRSPEMWEMQDYIVQCELQVMAVCNETYFDKFKFDLNHFRPAVARCQCYRSQWIWCSFVPIWCIRMPM